MVIFHLDIDECEQGSSGCNQNCNNTVGSYLCTCMDGYELEIDGHNCTGIDYIHYYVHVCIYIHARVSWHKVCCMLG